MKPSLSDQKLILSAIINVIHLFNIYFLKTYHVTDTVQGVGDVTVNNTVAALTQFKA